MNFFFSPAGMKLFYDKMASLVAMKNLLITMNYLSD